MAGMHDVVTPKIVTEGERSIPHESNEKKLPLTTDLELISSEREGELEVISEADYSPAEYKKLLRKIDRFLLPLMWFCYGIQQTDKTSLGTQAIFGLREDTGLVGQQYSWLTTIFYVGRLHQSDRRFANTGSRSRSHILLASFHPTFSYKDGPWADL